MSRAFEPLIPAEATLDANGVPFSPRYGDVYHTRSGALAQARHVFLAGNGLPQRWRGRRAFTVCETGFGLGNSFLALWRAWREDPQRCERLHFLSFEAHPFRLQDLRRLLMDGLAEPERPLAQSLLEAWPPLLPGVHRLEFEDGRVTLTLAFGSVSRLARETTAGVDAFFLDGFAPSVNPDMWSRELFGQLVRMALPGATVATWCCAGEVGRALGDAGFLVAKVAGLSPKCEMTVATLRQGLGRGTRPLAALQPVAIVGGGLAAAGVAQALALRGHEVTVFDPVFAHGLGGSHAGHLAAALTPVASRDDDIRSRLSRAGVLRARQRWAGLAADAAAKTCGTLERLPAGPGAPDWPAALRDLGFPADWLRWVNSEEAGEIAGIPLQGPALFHAAGMVLQPQPLLQALLGGPRIRTVAARVERLSPAPDGGWVLQGGGGTALARVPAVVLANAGEAPALLASVAGLARWPKLQAMKALAGRVSYFDSGRVPATRVVVSGDGYWLPPVNGLCVAGSTYRKEPGTKALPDPEAARQDDREIAAQAARLLGVPDGFPGVAAIVGGWSGWRVTPGDRLPMIGAVPDADGIWLACGYGSRGLTWAALAGDLIAAALNGEPWPLERELAARIAPR